MFSSPSYSAATIRYLCIYPTWSDDDGTHKTKKEYKLEFIEDTISKKAVLVGNLGFSNVFIIKGVGAVSFIEITDSGNVLTTTVTEKGVSVHSRNSVLLGKLIPSQYYGTCKIT